MQIFLLWNDVVFLLFFRTFKKVEPKKSMFSSLISSPCSIIGYLVLHTVGIRMIYPGSITLLNMLLSMFYSFFYTSIYYMY